MAADPRSGNMWRKFDSGFTVDYFFNQGLYADPRPGNGAFSRLRKAIEDSQHTRVRVVGSVGCGKSTFLTKALRDLAAPETPGGDARLVHRWVDFDQPRDRDPLRDPLSEVLTGQIIDEVKAGHTNGMRVPILRAMMNAVAPYGQASRIFELETGHSVGEFFNACQGLSENRLGTSFSTLKRDLKRSLRQVDLWALLLLGQAWDIVSLRRSPQSPSAPAVTVLDNLDKLKYDAALETLLDQYWNFNEHINKLITDNDVDIEYEEWTRTCWVFGMRETTFFEPPQGTEEAVNEYYAPAPVISVSGLYDVKDIVRKRVQYLRQVDEAGDLTAFYGQVEKVLGSPYHSSVMSYLMNHSYEKSCQTLVMAFADHRQELARLVQLADSLEHMRHDADVAKGTLEAFQYAFNGALLHEVVRSFRERGFLSFLQDTDPKATVDGRPGAVNPARLVLTCLQTLGGPYPDFRLQSPTDIRGIEISTLLKRLDGVLEPDTVLDTLWRLYENTPPIGPDGPWVWSRMCTLEGIGNGGRRALEEASLRADRHDSTTGERPVLARIHYAGVAYLRSVCHHFEFFSAREDEPMTQSLYGILIERGRDGVQVDDIRTTVDRVLSQFRKCSTALHAWTTALMESTGESDEEFLERPFVYRRMYRKGAKSGRYHWERIAIEHIQYLAGFRLLSARWQSDLDALASLNVYVAETVLQYCELFMGENRLPLTQMGQKWLTTTIGDVRWIAENPHDRSRWIGTTDFSDSEEERLQS
jgi:hypothetical protein